MILRACTKCGAPSADTYCPVHTPKPWTGSQRKARMSMSGSTWQRVRRRVLDRDRGVCYLCDKRGANEVDHLIEVAAGGTSRMDNLASCHAECHRRKHTDPEWAQPRVDMALRVLGGWGPTQKRSRSQGTVGVAAGARQSSPPGA